jgi:hypothetical protein
MSTPSRFICPGCCAPAASGHAAAPPSPTMNSRRRICHPLKLTLDSLPRAGLHGNGVNTDGPETTQRRGLARTVHCQHDTSNDRTPLARMLPSVIGAPAVGRGRVPDRRLSKLSACEMPHYWITSSAVANSVSGMVRNALAVLRLMTNCPR